MKFVAKIFILLVLFFIQPILLQAQNGRDKVELLRVAFISKNLELSNAESEKFWPVYNEYNEKIRGIKKNLRLSYRKKSEQITESEAEELFQLEMQSRQAEVDIQKQYSEKIKAIIGVIKTVKLKLAEEEFKREIIKSIKDKRD